jgi:hypothetical protein
MFSFNLAIAQQFNTDNHITMALGTANNCVTYGPRSATMLPSVGLFKNFEFFLGAVLIQEDEARQAEDHFSAVIMGKWMFYDTDDNSSGASATFGTGANPAYHAKDVKINSFRNYYAYADYTFTLFDKAISWDLNPGVQLIYDNESDSDKETWGFTYSTRVAIYKIIPKTAIVGEVYGALGDASANMEYRVGLRYESSDYIVPALSYGNSTDGSRGPGVEIGVIIISPPFLFD